MKVACLFPDARHANEASLQSLAESCLRFSSQVAVFKSECILIEIGKSRLLYSESSLAARARALCEMRFKFLPFVSIAEGAASAYILAKYKKNSLLDLPLESIADLMPDAEKQKTSAALLEALLVVGIKDMRAFLDLPTRELTARFGQAALLARYRLEGALDFAWPHFEPKPVFTETRSLNPEENTQDIEPLLFLMRPLLDRIFSRLWARGRRLSALKICLELERWGTLKGRTSPSREFDLTFLLPQSSSTGALPIVREKLARELSRDPLTSPCNSVTLSVLAHTPGYQAQRDYLNQNDKNEHTAETWSATLSHLSESLGTMGQIFSAKTLPQRLPEKAWTKTTKTQMEADHADRPGAATLSIPIRPTRVLKKPMPIELTASHLIVSRSRKSYAITHWSRPEILSEWLGTPIYRKYYTLTLASAPAAWVFCDEKDRYFIHGYFE